MGWDGMLFVSSLFCPQAAVDLVGKYILADNLGRGSGSALLETYFGALMERLVR